MMKLTEQTEQMVNLIIKYDLGGEFKEYLSGVTLDEEENEIHILMETEHIYFIKVDDYEHIDWSHHTMFITQETTEDSITYFLKEVEQDFKNDCDS